MKHAAVVRNLAQLACLLCLFVVVFGAYVRLSNAGLGCPDWPGCYGHLTPVGAAADAQAALHPLAGRPLNVGKAWREMLHRYLAGTLVVLIVCLAALGVAWRRERIVPTGGLLVLLGIVVCQAALGMLTVAWQLRPLIVTAHLLFGLTTLSLLWWVVLTLRAQRGAWGAATVGFGARRDPARRLALLALCVVAAQIALGGWTSSNYAALACPDLPTCQGHWWPPADFRSGFVLWRAAAVDYEGGILANAARVAIQLTHRVGAVCTSFALLAAVLAAWRMRSPAVRQAALMVALALALQLTLGASMVLRGFPLWLATAHNAGAALLLLATLALNRALHPVARTRS